MKLFESKEDIDRLERSGKILAEVLDLVSKQVKPGVSTARLDDFAEAEIKKRGGRPSFKGYTPRGYKRAFPATLCISVNEEIVHGIPNENSKILSEGDIVSLDCGVEFEGIFTDAAITVACGEVDEVSKNLLRATKRALEEGIKAAKPGKKTGDIGAAIERFASKTGFSIADDLGGHGVGFARHSDPFVPNFAAPREGVPLVPGMAIAIEPMLNEGTSKVAFCDDGYTVITFDGKRSAHFEHTVLITPKGAKILTAL